MSPKISRGAVLKVSFSPFKQPLLKRPFAQCVSSKNDLNQNFMKTLFSTLSATLILLILSCSDDDAANFEDITLRVNSYTVSCFGEAEGTCLLVQEGNMIGTEEWNAFYWSASIEGFSFEPNFVYELIVRRTPMEEVLIDGPSFTYQLLKTISKTPVSLPSRN
jgi:hypothetical protein